MRGQAQGGGWDQRLLFAPLNTLSPRLRRLAVWLPATLVVLWCGFLKGPLIVAWGLPDVAFYRDMANGHMERVPQPFSSRPLAPLLAHLIHRVVHGWDVAGFGVLAYLSLVCTALVVFWLLSRTAAPRWTVLAVAAVPFWPQLMDDAGLPDPLYAALLALLLLALAQRRFRVAAAMMLPLMLARESTTLTLLCLLLVAGRRLGWRVCLLALSCAAAGSLLVRHFSAAGMPNPEHLSGALYMTGKLVSNSMRSVGVLPWSNVYPELCGAPVWQLPVHVGGVRSFGVCAFSPNGPFQLTWALVSSFGLLPPAVLLGWGRWRQLLRRGSPVLRFSLLYGAASLLLAPALGTWYLRLVGYGWPLALVAVPYVLPTAAARTEPVAYRARTLQGGFLLLHLVSCALGARAGMPTLVLPLTLQIAGGVLLLGIWRQPRQALAAGPGDLAAGSDGAAAW